MNAMTRIVKEYSSLSHILSSDDFFALLAATMRSAPEVMRTGKLTKVDAAMSRNLSVHYRDRDVVFPLADIDRLLAYQDNPTFGNVREMCGRDCYLDHLKLSVPVGNVVDLGANRGMFSLLALTVLGAERVIGVEPHTKYEPVMQLLLESNDISPERVFRYNRLITCPSAEQKDPSRYVSMQTICKQQGLERIGMVKIDIEGYEKEIFQEPEWLAVVDNIAMEVHPQMVDDLSVIPQALQACGFQYATIDPAGKACDLDSAMYLFASRTGSLIA